MVFKIVWHEKSLRDLKSIDISSARRVVKKVKTHLVKDPRKLGKPLKGVFKGMYRYRLGDYRVVYVIDLQDRLIRILHVDHRKDVYR